MAFHLISMPEGKAGCLVFKYQCVVSSELGCSSVAGLTILPIGYFGCGTMNIAEFEVPVVILRGWCEEGYLMDAPPKPNGCVQDRASGSPTFDRRLPIFIRTYRQSDRGTSMKCTIYIK